MAMHMSARLAAVGLVALTGALALGYQPGGGGGGQPGGQPPAGERPPPVADRAGRVRRVAASRASAGLVDQGAVGGRCR